MNTVFRCLLAFLLIIALAFAPALAATLEGNGVALEVSEEAPLGIISVRHDPNTPALFVSGEQVQRTWELVMVDPGGNELKLDPFTRKLGGNVDLTDEKLTMVWDSTEVPGGTVKVSCSFERDPEQPLIYGNIAVDNNSDCQLREVQFPRMTLVPNPEPADNITLVFPRAYGRSWRNPFDAPYGYLVGTMEPAGFRGSAEMQFGTLYDDAGNGLYWAAYDGEGYQKRFVYDNKEVRGQIQLKLGHMPENCLTPGIDFASPYPIVLGAYHGDWWDAARMYREWALQQKWCAKGPLETREDVPDWIRDCDVWLRGMPGVMTLNSSVTTRTPSRISSRSRKQRTGGGACPTTTSPSAYSFTVGISRSRGRPTGQLLWAGQWWRAIRRCSLRPPSVASITLRM